MPVLVEVRNVVKHYGPIEALAGVSLDIDAGELFGLLGPNGAGKTTLIGIMTGLAAATAGEVRIAGRLITPTDHAARCDVGIAPQELALYPDLTARENLAFFGKLYGMSGAALDRRVDEVLTAVGLSERASHRVGTFSGGMQRRLNFGAAIVHRPRIVVLDEPTVGVDPQSRAHIFEEVRRLNATGATIIYTSHYMEEVQALCRRVGILDRGRLVACDSVAALLRSLGGTIGVRVERSSTELRARLAELPDTELIEKTSEFVLRCDDVRATVPRLLAILKATDAAVTGLDIREPNLERVFLHLTGRELRD